MLRVIICLARALASTTKSRHHLLMEYVDGPALDQVLATRGRLSWRMATKIIIKVAEGLGSLAECTDTSSTKDVRDALGKVVPEMRDS